jgi:hypothetical protein
MSTRVQCSRALEGREKDALTSARPSAAKLPSRAPLGRVAERARLGALNRWFHHRLISLKPPACKAVLM